MEHCDGYTHYEYDDSDMAQRTWPCPGPGHCLTSKLRPQRLPAPEPRFPAWDDLPKRKTSTERNG